MTDMVVDANSLFARSWFATKRKGKTLEEDQYFPVEALRIAFLTVVSLLDPNSDRIGVKFDRTLFGWDGANRQDKHRQDKPQEYYDTREIFKEVLTYAFGSAHAEHAEYEGDDTVATVVYSLPKTHSVYVVSGDKDLMQLAGGNVRYYCLNNKYVMPLQAILRKWKGIKAPCHIGLALAIIGDTVDGIKGIPKWGPVKAAKLFEAVPVGMPLNEVVDVIDAQIPGDLKPFFYESLDRTLLHDDVPGLPEPAPLKLMHHTETDSLNIPSIEQAYRQLYRAYLRG